MALFKKNKRIQNDYSECNERFEHIFEVQNTLDFKKKLKRYKQVHYSNSFVTTIYVGGRGRLSRSRLPTHVAIKIRFYHSKPRQKIFIPHRTTECIVEIKCRPKDQPRSNFRKKIRFGVKNTLYYGDVLILLQNFFSYKKINKTNPEVYSLYLELKKIAKEYHFTSFELLAATSYVRQHFYSHQHRITVDNNIKYYVATIHQNNIVFSLVQERKKPVFEVKIEQCLSLTYTKSFLLKKINEMFNSAISRSGKGIHLARLLSKYEHVFIEPELRSFSAKHWTQIEREMKLDATVNLHRDFKEIQFPYDVFSTTPVHSFCYQMVYKYNSRIVFFMKYKLTTPDTKGVIKYKTLQKSTNQKILVRSEVVEPYKKQRIMQILGAPLTDKDVLVTPYFKRDRKSRTVYMNTTRNVFDIYVDKVEFLNKKGTPLYQLEIEFLGVIDKKSPSKRIRVDSDSVNTDFMRLRNILIKEYARLGIILRDSCVTKAQWSVEQSIK